MSFDLATHMSNFGIAQRTIDLVRAHGRTLAAHVEEVVETYYAHLAGSDLAALMRSDRIDELKVMRIAHWRLLLAADFPAIRAHYMEQIGPRLVDGGFPRSIFVVAAEWFSVEFTRIVDRDPDIPRTIGPELRAALMRFAFFDLALALASRDVAWLD